MNKDLREKEKKGMSSTRSLTHKDGSSLPLCWKGEKDPSMFLYFGQIGYEVIC